MNDNDNIKESISQSKAIAAWLMTGHSITPLEALQMFGCLRLGARVWDLREKGMDIVSRKLQVSPRKRVSQYFLRPKEKT